MILFIIFAAGIIAVGGVGIGYTAWISYTFSVLK